MNGRSTDERTRPLMPSIRTWSMFVHCCNRIRQSMLGHSAKLRAVTLAAFCRVSPLCVRFGRYLNVSVCNVDGKTRVVIGAPSARLTFVNDVPPASRVVNLVCFDTSNSPAVPECTAVCPVTSIYWSFDISPKVIGALATPLVAGITSFSNIVQRERFTAPFN